VVPRGTSDDPDAGRMLAEVTNAMVRLQARYFGKGPTRSRSHLLDDVLVCVMRDVYTTVEQTLIEAGKADQVRATRQEFHLAMEADFVEMVERIVGRRVLAALAQTHVNPDAAVEIFLLGEEAEQEEPAP
jgi:uncharacterized protein YbcI